MSLVAGLFFSEWRVHTAEASSSMAQQLDCHFDGTISRQVLENYLDRSVTMAYFLVTGTPERNRQYPYREDDIRLIKNVGAKFIGRAIYRWGGESRLSEPGFWADAKTLIDRVHSFDPDVIFQGCLSDVNALPDPCQITLFTLFSIASVRHRQGSHCAKGSIAPIRHPG